METQIPRTKWAVLGGEGREQRSSVPLSLDGGVTSSGFDCPVPSSLDKRGYMGGGTGGQVGALWTETGKTQGNLPL